MPYAETLFRSKQKRVKNRKKAFKDFRGLLCNNCSTRIITEAAKVKQNVKASDQIKLEIKSKLRWQSTKCRGYLR